MRPIQLFIILIVFLAGPALAEAKPYQGQAPSARLGQATIDLQGPPAFVRIDGLDRNLDDILLATQSPSAAVLALYAEPAAWKTFQSRKNETGLHCHALISTPAPLADQNIKAGDFERIKKDLAKNLKASVKVERRLDGELAGVSDHQVESAKGSVESFTVLEEGDDFLSYQVVSTLELKYKDSASPRLSRSTTVSSTIVVKGKIINLQLVADPHGPGQGQLAETARLWRQSFTGRNQGG